MSKTIDQAISEIQAQIKDLEQEANKKKAAVNTLCEVAGIPPLYTINQDTPSRPYGNFRSDEFYGQPLATCVGKILESRKAAALGSASPDEIYTQLISGGFKFESKSDATAKRSMIIAISKNPKFHRIPNGEFGLAEWYPNAKRSSGKGATDKDVDEPKDEDLEEDQGDGQTQATTE